jgi:hypothetical protein
VPPRQRFRTGERIPSSGIYRVFHRSHRLPHEVTLLDGETFPRCLKCDTSVEFELVQQAPDLRNAGAFRVVLFGLPITDEVLEESVTAKALEPTAEMEGTRDQALSAEGTQTTSDRQSDGSPKVTSGEPEPLFGDGAHVTATKQKKSPTFKPGDLVPEHGIYTVEHDSHGLFHQATLAKDALFPKCRTCGAEVQFRLLRAGKPGSVMARLSSSVLEELDSPEPPATKAG